MLFSTVSVLMYISTNSAQGSLFSTSLPTLICSLFGNNHSKRCEVTSHCGVESLGLVMLSSFRICWPSVCLWKNVYSDTLPIFLAGIFVLFDIELYEFLIDFGN